MSLNEICELGVIGLTSIGQSLAAHHAAQKRRVCVFDHDDPSFVPQVVKEFKTLTEQQDDEDDTNTTTTNRPSRCMVPSTSIEEFAKIISTPRKIIIFGTQNDDKKFDDIWNKLRGYLTRGDMVLRWGEEDGTVTMLTTINPRDQNNNLQFYTESIVGNLSKSQAEPLGINLLEMVKLEQDRAAIIRESDTQDTFVVGGAKDAYDQLSLYVSPFAAIGHVGSSAACAHYARMVQRAVELLEMVKLEQDRAAIIRESDTQDTFVVGGAKDAYDQLSLYVSPFAAIGHVGSSAACAHYARMVQRAVEFGITQCLAEGCDLLKKAALYENQDVGRTLTKWQEGGIITSYLVEMSSKIYYKRDGITKQGHVIDHIIDSVDLNGSDTWFSLEATKLGVPSPTISAALEARFLSNMKDERVDASSILGAPEGADTPSVMKDQIADDLQNAIYSAWICVIAEGLSIFVAAAEVGQWEVNLAECIRLWNLPASFLKSDMLEKMHSVLTENQGNMQNVLLLPGMASQLQETHMSWRRIVTLCFASAIPCPCLGASLTYYDSYRSKVLPSNLIRAQRDFFGGYGYDRFNEEGWYTSCWVQEHTDGLKRATKKLEKGANDDTKKKKKRKTK